MKWRDGNVRNKETFSDVTFTIQAHKYNWLPIFGVFFFAESNTISQSHSLYPVSYVAHTTAATSLPTGSFTIYIMPKQHTLTHAHDNHNTDIKRPIYSKVQSPNMSNGTWKPVVMCTRTIIGTGEFIFGTNGAVKGIRLIFTCPNLS